MVWLLVFPALLSPVAGKQSLSARHVATLVHVYDGDTITVDVVLWPGLTWCGMVRVVGVDTPQIQTKSKSEKRRALLARDFVRERIGDDDLPGEREAGQLYGTDQLLRKC